MKKSAIFMLLACILTAYAANAINLDQVDDFQNGTTQNWQEGGQSPNPPTNQSGGPSGASDRYLRNVSACCGAGGRNVMFNQAQWTGDYLAAGVSRIQMTARAFDSEGLVIRLHFKRSDFGSEWITDGMQLPADGQWHTLVFSLEAADMTSVAGLGTHEQIMSDVGEVRLGNFPQASVPAPMVDATLGVDDITALGPEAPPEPEVPDDVLLDLVALDDVNNSASADLAVLEAAMEQAAPAVVDSVQADHLNTTDIVHVRDGGTGQEIVRFEITNVWHSIQMDTITVGGVQRLLILQTKDDGSTRVMQFDAVDGTQRSTISFFDNTWTAVDLVAVSDGSGPGVAAIGVLATNQAGQNAIEVRTPGNGSLLKSVPYFNNVWTVFGARDLGDFNGNGRSELSVLARNGAGKNAVETRDSSSGVRLGTMPRVFFLGPANELVDFTGSPDVNGNGRPELIVLGKRDAGSNTAQAKDARTGDLIGKYIMLGPQWTTFGLRSMNDVDGNSGAEIIAAAVNGSNITNVQIRDLGAGTVTERFGFLGPAYDPRDFEVMDDVTGNSIQDVALVGRRADTGQIRVQIRDASTGARWRNIDLPAQ